MQLTEAPNYRGKNLKKYDFSYLHKFYSYSAELTFADSIDYRRRKSKHPKADKPHAGKHFAKWITCFVKGKTHKNQAKSKCPSR